jgi:purine-nucleoside/S-methyl-5'-thioadenosine phosphorylase / adenosine deaminase
MTDVSISRLAETPLSGSVPRFEIPGWRDRFGVVAGITARGAGGSEAFDLGLWTAESVCKVMTRWRAFRSAEAGFRGFAMAHQVHGSQVGWHEQVSGWTILEGLDGHLTRTPGLMLLVTVADCIPIYLIDRKRNAVGLLHAGWRGTAAGILRRGIDALVEVTGSPPADVVMHCGVGICASCYEVGTEVMEACRLPHHALGPWHLDLRAVLADQAVKLGVGEISVSSYCSAHDGASFFSHRRSGGTDGRMVAYIGLPVNAT